MNRHAVKRVKKREAANHFARRLAYESASASSMRHPMAAQQMHGEPHKATCRCELCSTILAALTLGGEEGEATRALKREWPGYCQAIETRIAEDIARVLGDLRRNIVRGGGLLWDLGPLAACPYPDLRGVHTKTLTAIDLIRGYLQRMDDPGHRSAVAYMFAASCLDEGVPALDGDDEARNEACKIAVQRVLGQARLGGEETTSICPDTLPADYTNKQLGDYCVALENLVRAPKTYRPSGAGQALLYRIAVGFPGIRRRVVLAWTGGIHSEVISSQRFLTWLGMLGFGPTDTTWASVLDGIIEDHAMNLEEVATVMKQSVVESFMDLFDLAATGGSTTYFTVVKAHYEDGNRLEVGQRIAVEWLNPFGMATYLDSACQRWVPTAHLVPDCRELTVQRRMDNKCEPQRQGRSREYRTVHVGSRVLQRWASKHRSTHWERCD